MKTTLSWLKEYVDIDIDIKTLCQKLVSAGFEVEETSYLGENLSNVIVGKVVSIEKHPDADRLRVCQIDVGRETVQIVTGASNVREGDVVPAALHSSCLPCGKRITRGKLRGVESNGMLCGGEELGINDDVYPGASVDGILILSPDEPLGADVKEVLGLDDYLLDVSITSNRPDAGSVYGLAREIAVVLGKKLKPADINFSAKKGSAEDYLYVEVSAKDLCPSYNAAVVTDAEISRSPVWMTRRLHFAGLRSINAFVDITNYVLLEMGQPMHAFDYSELTDKTIVVRRAKADEKITLLDEKEYALDTNSLVIADKTKAVGLAGIMGGKDSGIKGSTQTIVFEAAKFIRENIRRTSRKLKVQSDSSARFERGVDAYTTKLALSRALNLVQKLGCGKIVSERISIETTTEPARVSFDFNRIEKLLGITVPREAVKKILDSLEIKTEFKGDEVICAAPPYREDISRDCDIIEEIIRIYGYDKINSTLLGNSQITKGGKKPDRTAADKAKNALCGLGYFEAITYSFCGRALINKARFDPSDDKTKYISIFNPLGEELSLMRTSLVPSLLEVASSNQSKSNYEFKLFELAKVYLSEEDALTKLPEEKNKLALITSGRDFYALKSDIKELLSVLGIRSPEFSRSNEKILHPGISADISVNGEKIGYFGQIHPKIAENFSVADVCAAEIDFDAALKHCETEIKFAAIPKFPAIERDLALVVDDGVMAKQLTDIIIDTCPLCESVSVFDVYKGSQIAADKKSVALNLIFRNAEATLKDADIEPQINKCLKVLEEKLGAKLR